MFWLHTYVSFSLFSIPYLDIFFLFENPLWKIFPLSYWLYILFIFYHANAFGLWVNRCIYTSKCIELECISIEFYTYAIVLLTGQRNQRMGMWRLGSNWILYRSRSASQPFTPSLHITNAQPYTFQTYEHPNHVNSETNRNFTVHW